MISRQLAFLIFGSPNYDPLFDPNGDGVIDALDLNISIENQLVTLAFTPPPAAPLTPAPSSAFAGLGSDGSVDELDGTATSEENLRSDAVDAYLTIESVHDLDQGSYLTPQRWLTGGERDGEPIGAF